MNIKLSKNLYWTLDTVWRHRFFILLPIIVMPIVGYIVGSAVPNQYKSSITISIKDPLLYTAHHGRTSWEGRKQNYKNLIENQLVPKTAESLGIVNLRMTPTERAKIIGKLKNNLKFRLITNEIVKIIYNSDQPDDGIKVLTTLTALFIHARLAVVNPLIEKLENEIAEVGANLTELRSRYTDKH